MTKINYNDYELAYASLIMSISFLGSLLIYSLFKNILISIFTFGLSLLFGVSAIAIILTLLENEEEYEHR